MPFNIQGTPISDPVINEILQKFKSSSDGRIKNSLANNNIDNWQEANSLVNPDNNRVVDEGDLTANNKNLKEKKKLTSEDLYTLAQFFLHNFPEKERKSVFDWVFLPPPQTKTEQARVALLLRAGGFQSIGSIEGTTFFQKTGEITQVDPTGTKVVPGAKKIIKVDAKGEIILFNGDSLNWGRLPGREEFQKMLKQPGGRRAFQEELKKIGFNTTIAPGVYYKEGGRFPEEILMEEKGELLEFVPALHDPIIEEKEAAKIANNGPTPEKLTFEGIKEVEILAYDKVSATIKPETRSVMVYRNSFIENYYDWQAEDGKPYLKLIQRRLLHSFSSPELSVRSFPKQSSHLNLDDLTELAKAIPFGEGSIQDRFGTFFGEGENIDKILKDDDKTIRSLGLTRQAIARGLMYFVNLYYYLQLRQIGGGVVSTVISYQGKRFLLSGNSYRAAKTLYFSDGKEPVSNGTEAVIVITNITDPKRPQRLLCAGVIAKLIGTHGFYGGKFFNEPHKQHWGKSMGEKSYRIPPARAALVLGLAIPEIAKNVAGHEVFESPEDLEP